MRLLLFQKATDYQYRRCFAEKPNNQKIYEARTNWFALAAEERRAASPDDWNGIGLHWWRVMLLCGLVFEKIAADRDSRRYPSPGAMIDVGVHSSAPILFDLHANCKHSVVLDF